MDAPTIGVIGGTGLGDALTSDHDGEQLDIETPYGTPSSSVMISQWNDCRVCFLARHGKGHKLNPSQVPYRANIYALKTLGVTHLIASGAVGSLREDIHPRDLVIVDQVIDKTFRRESTFFDRDLAVHVEFSQPTCAQLRDALRRCGPEIDTTVHDRGVYVCMEGPQFSTVAESHMHRAWGGDLIGMTCMPEAKLAREAEMCYALVALPTDYDCWRPTTQENQHVLLEEIIGHLKAATQNAIDLIKRTITTQGRLFAEPCRCHQSLELALWTDRSMIGACPKTALLLKKYLP